jgi:hypothetical protein
VSLKHLDGYLEEFTFRFNRRRARRITHGAGRLLTIAMTTRPVPSGKSLAVPKEKPDSPAQPDDRGDPSIQRGSSNSGSHCATIPVSSLHRVDQYAATLRRSGGSVAFC